MLCGSSVATASWQHNGSCLQSACILVGLVQTDRQHIHSHPYRADKHRTILTL